MKKTYISPTTVEIALSTTVMLNEGSLNLNAQGGSATPFEVEAEGESLSRRSGFWDDED